MNFGIWQIIYLSFMAANLLIGANMHGKQKTGEHSFWITVIASTLGFSIVYFGGFFK